MQKEIKQLKELLIKKNLNKLVMGSYLEVAAEKLNYKSVEDLKKLKHLSLVKAVEKTKHTGQASMEQICQCFGIHRDTYYKFKIRKQKKEAFSAKVLELVTEKRIE